MQGQVIARCAVRVEGLGVFAKKVRVPIGFRQINGHKFICVCIMSVGEVHRAKRAPLGDRTGRVQSCVFPDKFLHQDRIFHQVLAILWMVFKPIKHVVDLVHQHIGRGKCTGKNKESRVFHPLIVRQIFVGRVRQKLGCYCVLWQVGFFNHASSKLGHNCFALGQRRFKKLVTKGVECLFEFGQQAVAVRRIRQLSHCGRVAKFAQQCEKPVGVLFCMPAVNACTVCRKVDQDAVGELRHVATTSSDGWVHGLFDGFREHVVLVVLVKTPIEDTGKDPLFLGVFFAMQANDGLWQKHGVGVIQGLMQVWQAQGLFGVAVSCDKVL